MNTNGLNPKSAAVQQTHAPMSELSDAELDEVSGGEMRAVASAWAGTSGGGGEFYGSNFVNFCYGER